MTLALDDQRAEREMDCPSCGRSYRFVTGFIYQDGDAAAIYHAQCHGHEPPAAVWLDVVLGDPEAQEFSGQFTFASSVSVEGAGLVDAPATTDARGDYFGTTLSRTEALEHDRLAEVWEIVDFIVTVDPTVRSYVYGTHA